MKRVVLMDVQVSYPGHWSSRQPGQSLYCILDERAEEKKLRYEDLRALISKMHAGAEVVVLPLIFSSIGFATPDTTSALSSFLARDAQALRSLLTRATTCIVDVAYQMYVARAAYMKSGAAGGGGGGAGVAGGVVPRA